MEFNVIETFSGIGAQAKALKNLENEIKYFEPHIRATVEWDIGAMYAYDIIHHGPQKLEEYDSFTKEELIERLKSFNLSSDGKNSLKSNSLKRMSLPQLQAISHSIDKNKNLVDITRVKASDLPDADLLTYSFPCQDLSISSFWHGNISGISKDAGNRSGLLWEIERILHEYVFEGKTLPRFLLMENVSAIHGRLHKENFDIWLSDLRSMGYTNEYFDLDASNFGIPQSRVRTFMISVYTDDLSKEKISKIKNFFKNTSLRNQNKTPRIDDFLRLDYSKNEQYLLEAIKSTPNDTPSRQKIRDGSRVLAEGQKPNNYIAKTITTKQDRYPNAGIIFHERTDFGEKKSEYRNLTPRETFLLMGFQEDDFQRLVDNNIQITKSRTLLSNSKLLHLSGNSIVVNILEEVFRELIKIKKLIDKPTKDLKIIENQFKLQKS